MRISVSEAQSYDTVQTALVGKFRFSSFLSNSRAATFGSHRGWWPWLFCVNFELPEVAWKLHESCMKVAFMMH